jgi:hypothetical protein
VRTVDGRDRRLNLDARARSVTRPFQKEVTMLTIIAKLALLGAMASPSTSDPPPGRHHSWFGLDICVGEVADANDCDIRVHAPPQPAATTSTRGRSTLPLEIDLFGRSLCLGDVPRHVDCDLRLQDTTPKPA